MDISSSQRSQKECVSLFFSWPWHGLDFNKWCKQTGGAAFKCPTLPLMFNDTLAVVRAYNLSRVFVACDPRYLPGVLTTFGGMAKQAGTTLSLFALPPSLDHLLPGQHSNFFFELLPKSGHLGCCNWAYGTTLMYYE